jgi:hypothetical protein
MDFATGERGDVIDFYALAKGISAGEALNELWARIESEGGRTYSNSARPAEKDDPLEETVIDPNDPFNLPYRPSQAEYDRMEKDSSRLIANKPAVAAMVEARAWKEEVVLDLAFEGVLGLSTERCITFNFLSGSKSRWLDGTGKRRFRWNFGKPWFWRGDLILRSDNLWIVEGETKLIKALCWEFEKEDRRVVALPAANFDVAPWAKLFSGKKVTYIADPDPAGQRCAERLVKALEPVASSVVILKPEELGVPPP